MKANRKYKDRLFRLLFGSEKYKDNILSLYNALNGTDYTDAGGIEINTIEDVIYIGMKNDVSFIISDNMSLWEQQSSYNPNMPVRGFMYFGKLYDRYIEEQEESIYGKKLIKLPTPQYIVLYNGSDDRPALETMRLSDAFINKPKDDSYEWTATVYNLNSEENRNLLDKCRPLAEYVELVKRISSAWRKGMNKADAVNAVNAAIQSCIDDGILADFLRAHRAEVIEVCLTEFDAKKYEKTIREEGRIEGLEEGRAEGREEGRAEGREEGICETAKGFKEQGVDPVIISKVTGIPIDEIAKL